MKFGAHVYLWHDRLDEASLLALLERAARLRLDFLEIPVGDDVVFRPERLGAAARDLGLALVTSPGAAWPLACDLSLPDAADRQRGLDWHRREVDRAVACGAIAYTGALYGHPGRVERGAPPAGEQDWIVAGLAALADHAAPGGLTLAIEPMSHFRTHIATTPAQGAALVALAGRPNLRLLCDTYHMVTEIADYPAALAAVVPVLWGIHACENHRGCPGTGLLPWAAMGAALRAAGWAGYVGCESYNTAWQGGAFARRRGLLQPVCPDGDAFVRQARAALAAWWTA